MTATFLVPFVALAGCQILLAVKLADWLSPSAAGRGSAEPVRPPVVARPA